MMTSKRIVCVLLAVALPYIAAFSQENPHLTRPHYGGEESYFMETQAWQIMTLARESLNANPPAPVNVKPIDNTALARKMALLGIDGVVHNKANNGSAAVKDFVLKGAVAVLKALEEPVTEGLVAYHIYDMGFIVRSASTTIALDLSAQEGAVLPQEIMDALADKCDALFVTHRHNDHYDPPVVERFLAAGKQVVVPNDCHPEYKRLTHSRKDGGVFSGKVKLPNGKKLSYKILPGHQNETETTWVECNHVCVTFPEGYSIVHLGDQAHPEDNSWMKEAKGSVPSIDLMFVTCWMGDTSIIIPGYDPKVVLTGHANELNHPVVLRIPYWYAYHQYENFPYSAVIMAWGESYHYRR